MNETEIIIKYILGGVFTVIGIVMVVGWCFLVVKLIGEAKDLIHKTKN